MVENDTPESIQVIQMFLREVHLYDPKFFDSIGGFSAYTHLSSLEILVKRLGRQNEHLSRSAEQRDEAAATAQKCPACRGRGYKVRAVSMYACNRCHGSGISKSA